MRRLAAWLALAGALVAGCGTGSSGGSAPPTGPPAPKIEVRAGDPQTTAYDAAVSSPRGDSVYPDVGDPAVDALYYGLHLAWQPQRSLLIGSETLLFRATRTQHTFSLDLARQLTVRHAWLDGEPVRFQHASAKLVIEHEIDLQSRHVLQLAYQGNPEPVKAPTDRRDFQTSGWTVARNGTVWTMQEPYGAYSWYAVSDQPSDKAFYDATIDAPPGEVGVFNGQLRSRTRVGRDTVTRWHLPEPAASYLVTIAIGRLTGTQVTGPHGLPITYWTPIGRPALLRKVRYATRAVAYDEHLLGRYPFPTLGLLVVPSQSAMETQSMITLGENRYDVSRDTIVHEIAHQWYGDAVTPDDWSDLWMNEGMATYVAEANWTATHGHGTLAELLRSWARVAPGLRARFGPPAHYRALSFAEGNAYYIPALMWDTIRQRLGDREFWSLVRRWVTAHRFTSQDRTSLASWWSKESGQDLTPVFDQWLLGPREPQYHAG